MPRLLSSNVPMKTRRHPSWKSAVALNLAMYACLALVTPALAQDEDPAADVPAEAQVATEAPPPPPTELPPPPPTTEAPVIVEPTSVPTDVPAPPTDAPTTAPVVEPPALPSEEPSPTPEPTPSPTPTLTPAPELTYTLADAPDCQLAPGGPSSVASNGSIEYVCTDRVTLAGTNVVPANIAVEWTMRASIEGGWSVRLLPPKNSPEETVAWTADNSAAAGFTFGQANSAGVSVMPGTVDATATIEFRVRIHRADCGTVPRAVLIDHDITVQSPETTVVPASNGGEPHRITPDLLAVPEPGVAFNGPLDFGEVGRTAGGADTTVTYGTLSLTVTELDAACGDWNLQVSATALTNQSGSPMAGSRLVVVSIDDQPIPDGGCDLAGQCDLMSLAGGPDAQSTRTITLGVELHMPQQPDPGSFTTSIDALLLPAATS